MDDILDLYPRRTVSLNPEEYLTMSPAQKSNVRTTRFNPPRLGDDDFGRFIVMLKTPEYSFGRKK